MASRKIADLAIKIGEYEQAGEKRSRNKKIGSLMQTEDGRQFVMLDATVLTMEINYLANPGRRTDLIVSVFDVDGDDRQSQPAPSRSSPAQAPARAPSQAAARRDIDDEIPFN
jgi:hypothetical protein